MQEDPSLVLKIMRKMSRRIKELEDALVRTAEPVAAASTVQTPPTDSSRGLANHPETGL
jgi:CRP-like cAMP-binding protein